MRIRYFKVGFSHSGDREKLNPLSCFSDHLKYNFTSNIVSMTFFVPFSGALITLLPRVFCLILKDWSGKKCIERTCFHETSISEMTSRYAARLSINARRKPCHRPEATKELYPNFAHNANVFAMGTSVGNQQFDNRITTGQFLNKTPNGFFESPIVGVSTILISLAPLWCRVTSKLALR